MSYVGRFARFWYDFIVGDDWRLAIGTIVILVLTHLVVTRQASGWLLLPLAVVALLASSVLLTARSR